MVDTRQRHVRWIRAAVVALLTIARRGYATESGVTIADCAFTNGIATDKSFMERLDGAQSVAPGTPSDLLPSRRLTVCR